MLPFESKQGGTKHPTSNSVDGPQSTACLREGRPTAESRSNTTPCNRADQPTRIQDPEPPSPPSPPAQTPRASVGRSNIQHLTSRILHPFQRDAETAIFENPYNSMSVPVGLKDIQIRTELKPGDIGYITYLHGTLYRKEYGFGIAFEAYVARGLHEFYEQFDPGTNRIWICEHENKIIGSLVLMNRGKEAQLRYFLILPEYRGIGLGNTLMEHYMEFLHRCGYESSYLWTTEELFAAAHLYRKYGFELVEEKPSDVFGKALNENKYVMRVGR